MWENQQVMPSVSAKLHVKTVVSVDENKSKQVACDKTCTPRSVACAHAKSEKKLVELYLRYNHRNLINVTELFRPEANISHSKFLLVGQKCFRGVVLGK